MLIGATPLKYIGNKTGITSLRGMWFDICLNENITYKCLPICHPSYVLRKMYMADGKQIMADFENDIKEVAIRAGFIKE
jgi:uracil-DNA glycosylase